MHRKYLIVAPLYISIWKKISNYSKYFDDYSNVVKAFQLSTAFRQFTFCFYTWVTACRSTEQHAVGSSQRYGPVHTDHRHLECDWNAYLPNSWEEWATDIFNKQQIFYMISSIYNILTKKSDVIYFEWIVIWNWEKTPKY